MGAVSELTSTTKYSQSAAFTQDVAMERHAALISYKIDHTANRISAIKRRARSAEDLNPAYIRDNQVFQETGSIALRGTSIAKSKTVNQHRCVFIAQPACFDRGE